MRTAGASLRDVRVPVLAVYCTHGTRPNRVTLSKALGKPLSGRERIRKTYDRMSLVVLEGAQQKLFHITLELPKALGDQVLTRRTSGY